MAKIKKNSENPKGLPIIFARVILANEQTKIKMGKLIFQKMAKLKTSSEEAIDLLALAYKWNLPILEELMEYFEKIHYKLNSF